MVSISLIIVNYNTKEYLSRCVKSIYESGISPDSLQLIILDNSSQDSSLKRAQDFINKKSLS